MRIKSPRETENELKEFWKINELKFTAQFAINRQGKGYFRNVRRLDGNSCVFPDGSRLTIPASNIKPLEIDREYIIHAFVAPEPKRKELGIPYLLYLDTINNAPKINQQTPKQYVQRLYNQFQAAEGILKDSLSGAIKRLAVETNKKAETFIYEILQNADDYPDPIRKRVNIRFKILDKYLIVIHNGQPFKENNVYAICTVASGDKENDINKTGYKGIGFKSIFKHSNYVWIHSGEFSFRFDEAYHRQRGNETFWQLIPIWTELSEVENIIKTTDLVNAPVSIAIKPKDGETRLVEYENIFKNVFKDERVLLFLRSIQSLAFHSSKLTFAIEKSSKNWEISNLAELQVPKDLQERINKLIDSGSDDLIPVKFKDIETTKLTFATILVNGEIAPTTSTRIYAYLPTDLNFGLPFLINGDFIPDGSREKLFWDLEWNQFLFKQAGYSFIEWLRSIYSKYKDANLIKLMPDVDQLFSEELDDSKKDFLLLFKEGMIEGIKSVSFIPDIKGNLQPLNELVIDLTGLSGIMSEILFRQCIGLEGPIMHPSFASVKTIERITNELDLGEKFGKPELLNVIHDDELQEWLKKPENNISFLKLLISKNWLSDFDDKSIYLSANGDTHNSISVYYDLGDDYDLLHWTEVIILHQDLRKRFKVSELNVRIYEPLDFIDSYILTKQSHLDNLIESFENNISFYQYLFKHHTKLLDTQFDNLKLGYFRVFGYDGKIIDSVGNSVYLLNTDLKKLYEGKSFPGDHIYLLDPGTFAPQTSVGLWKPFWAKFSVKELTELTLTAFINEKIISQSDSLFSHFRLSGEKTEDNSLIRGNQLLWLFLFKSINSIPKARDKEFKDAISLLPVYVKNEPDLYSLNECYLPKEYTANDTLEILVEQYTDIEIRFVSDLYLTEKILSADKWTNLFETFHVKTDVKDLLLHYLIPGIDQISEGNLLSVTQLFFENRDFLSDQFSTLNIKLKTTSGSWLPAKETVIGGHYTKNAVLEHTLQSIVFDNVISDEYSQIRLNYWTEFFKNLGALEYSTKEEIVSLKIEKMILDKLPLNADDTDITFSLIKELNELSITENLTDKHYEILRSMFLLLKGEGEVTVYERADRCHFSKEYNPKLNLEEIIPDTQLPEIFISAEYLKYSGSLKELKTFFKKIGVKESFFIRKSDLKLRKDADPLYIQAIDNSNSTIRTNAISWSSQHKIKPWNELSYQKYLNIHLVSLNFWETILSSEKFLKEIFESPQYHYYFPSVIIPGYIEWFIKNTPSIPAKDGKCYKPSDLYSTQFKKFINNNSLLSKIDLSGTNYKEKSLEEFLGFRLNLTLDLCIQRFENMKDVSRLKKEGIWETFINLLEGNKLSAIESASLNDFLEKGSLPNQLNEWRNIKELYFIQDDFNLGIGNSLHLIHDELRSIARRLAITGLLKKDFNPEFKGLENEKFFEVLKYRLKYITLAEGFPDLEKTIKEIIDLSKHLNFQSTSRISFSFKKVEPAIENTEKTFYTDNNNVYYVGHWKGARAAELFSYIHKLLKLEHISVKILQDMLLLTEPEILEFFEEKNIKYPDEWKPKNLSTNDDTNKENNTNKQPDKKDNSEVREKTSSTDRKSELTDEEVAELEALLNRQLTPSEMANTLIIALYKALKHYEAVGYNVEAPKKNIEECIRKRMLEGVLKIDTKEVKTVIVRSAKKGILHLNYLGWSDLNNAQTELFVVTGNSSSDYLLFRDQKSLSGINKDSWVAKIGGDDKYAELSSLLSGEYLNPDKKFSPLQFLIRVKENEEYQSIFERIYSTEKYSDFVGLD